jgi:hypothetical protein
MAGNEQEMRRAVEDTLDNNAIATFLDQQAGGLGGTEVTPAGELSPQLLEQNFPDPNAAEQQGAQYAQVDTPLDPRTGQPYPDFGALPPAPGETFSTPADPGFDSLGDYPQTPESADPLADIAGSIFGEPAPGSMEVPPNPAADVAVERERQRHQTTVPTEDLTEQEWEERYNQENGLGPIEGAPGQPPVGGAFFGNVVAGEHGETFFRTGRRARFRRPGVPMAMTTWTRTGILKSRAPDELYALANLKENEYLKHLYKISEISANSEDDQARVLGQQADWLANNEDELTRFIADNDDRLNQHQQYMQQWMQRIASNTIDPDRFYSSRGAGARIGSSVAVALGTFAAIRSGQPNYALNIINSAIDRDIEAQVQDAAAQRGAFNSGLNLYSMMLQSTGDGIAAREAVRALHLDNTIHQVESIVASTLAPIRRQEFQAFLEKLKLDQARADIAAAEAQFAVSVETQYRLRHRADRMPAGLSPMDFAEQQRALRAALLATDAPKPRQQQEADAVAAQAAADSAAAAEPSTPSTTGTPPPTGTGRRPGRISTATPETETRAPTPPVAPTDQPSVIVHNGQEVNLVTPGTMGTVPLGERTDMDADSNWYEWRATRGDAPIGAFHYPTYSEELGGNIDVVGEPVTHNGRPITNARGFAYYRLYAEPLEVPSNTLAANLTPLLHTVPGTTFTSTPEAHFAAFNDLTGPQKETLRGAVERYRNVMITERELIREARFRSVSWDSLVGSQAAANFTRAYNFMIENLRSQQSANSISVADLVFANQAYGRPWGGVDFFGRYAGQLDVLINRARSAVDYNLASVYLRRNNSMDPQAGQTETARQHREGMRK